MRTSYGRRGDAPPPPAEPPEQVRSVSLLLSPVHLLLPVFEATIEVNAADWLGLSLIGGYGTVRVTSTSLFEEETDRFDVYELGGQVSFYPGEQAFEGGTFGLEVLYVRVDVSDEYEDGEVTGFGDGLAVGPFGGYKWIVSGGFTFVLQAGEQYITLHAVADDGDGSASADEQDWIVLLNANLGWSL